MHALSTIVTFYQMWYLRKKPLHDSVLSGWGWVWVWVWVWELLDGNLQQMKDQLGMHSHVFCELCGELASKASLGHTCYVSLEEQAAIFLYVAATNLSNRKVAEHFQQSGDTISKY
jgi:hypothetical protein